MTHRAIFCTGFLLIMITLPAARVRGDDEHKIDAIGSNALVTPEAPAKPTLPPPPALPPAPPRSPVAALLTDSLMYLNQQKTDLALDRANQAIKLAPQDPNGYGMRGSVYTETKQWDLATKDYLMVLKLNPNDITAQFNLAEVKFRQKLYPAAREAFSKLTNNPLLGELAQYKVFLCDLFGGNEAVAKKELDAFNDAGSGPAYYFGNAAWSLYHKQIDDGRNWMISAVRIFSQDKVNLYGASLKYLGYLPLPNADGSTNP